MSEREKSALYPGATWNECIEFVETVDAFKLKSVSYAEVAKKYGLSSPTTKSFTYKLGAAKQFGLISTIGGNTIQLTETCKRLLYPTGGDIRSTQLSCFSLPPLYNKLIAQYDGKALPNETILSNIFMNEHKITISAKDTAAKSFIQSAEQLNLIKGGILNFSDSTATQSTEQFAKIENETENNPTEVKYSETTNPSTTVSLVESDYITQNIPMKSGKVAKIIIPIDSEADDLLLLKDMLDIILRRKFKIKID